MTRSLADILGKLENEARLQQGRRLPSIRALAATWGVSTSLIQQAVREAVHQGWLETRPGSGIWPAGCIPSPTPPANRMDALRVAESIALDIQAGKFASDQFLPSPKDYYQRWGIHPSTARKAMRILESRELVVRKARSWTVDRPNPRKSARSPVLLCIGAPGQDGKLRMDTDPEWDFWREIQAEAIRNGLEPRVVTWKDGSLPPAIDAYGVVVSTWHMLDSSVLLDALLRRRIPTSIWAANHEDLPGQRYRDARTMWFHDLANGRGAGLTMARYVAGLGHRRVAWISPFQASPWARNRLAGLKQGLPGDVDLYEINGEWTSEWDIQKDHYNAPSILDRVRTDGVASDAEIEQIARPLVEAITRERAIELFRHRFEQALRTQATLWVAASDLTARWSLHWLRSKGLSTPGDIALAGFDDTREATHLDLTSLRFDVQEMARAMIRQVVSSRQSHRILTRYTGHVVERASTAGFPKT